MTNSKLNRHTTAREAGEDLSFLGRLRQQEPKEARTVTAPDDGAAGTAASLHLYTVPEDDFSLLALRDRVVIMLLFDQVVREDQVMLAWQLWHQMDREGPKEPLWRVLTLFPDLDRELVYAEAARVYGFEEARISRSYALALIKDQQARIDTHLWDEMVELRLMPITEVTQKHTHHKRLVFATPDPTRSDVHRLLSELGLEGFELRYARESEILNLLIEAFPRRYNHLKGLSGVTKDFLAAVYPDDEPFLGAGATDIDAPLIISSEEWHVPTGTSALAVFESVLVDAVLHKATDVCLLPHPGGQTDVYFQIGEELTRRRIIEHLPPDLLLRTIKGSIIRQPASDEGIKKRLIQRWVDDTLVRFRVSAVPASDEVHTECIVVRVYA